MEFSKNEKCVLNYVLKSLDSGNKNISLRDIENGDHGIGANEASIAFQSLVSKRALIIDNRLNLKVNFEIVDLKY